MSGYPATLDSLPSPAPTDTEDGVIGGTSNSAYWAEISAAVRHVQSALGVDPQGMLTTVAERILITANGNLLDQVADVSFTADDDTDGIPNGWDEYDNASYTASLSAGKLHADADNVFAIISPSMPVEELLYYNLSAYLQSVAGNLVLKIEWYDAAEDLVDYDYEQWAGVSARTRRAISIAAPATTVAAKVTIESNGGGEAYFELPSFRIDTMSARVNTLSDRQDESEVKQTFAYATKFVRG